MRLGISVMSRGIRMIARCLVILAVLFPLIAATVGQTLPSTSSDEDSIALRGVVVSSVDRTPIRAALVQLLGKKPRAMLTGADGAFQFDGLGAGDAVVVARKPGYFSAQEYYPESVGEQHVHLVANLKPIELKLYPEAVVCGRVTNENGRPLEGFTVQLIRVGAKGSGSRRGSLPSTLTNENGEYRLAELRAGTYLISVSKKLDGGGPVALFQASKFRVGYPTYFYPSVTDSNLATPVHLTPGKQIQADLRMASQPLCRISGNVQGATKEGAIIVVAIGAHDVSPVAATSLAPGITNFVLEGVPAGSYLVGAIQPSPGEGEWSKTGIARVDVTPSEEPVSIALFEDQKVQVKFSSASPQPSGNSEQGPNVLVTFLRTDLQMENPLLAASMSAGPDGPDGESTIALPPGEYRAQVRVAGNRCVASVKSGTTELLKEDLVVTTGGVVEPIKVVVRDDCGRVQGVVSKEGQPAMGRVLLIPEGAPWAGLSTAANSDGAFQFQGLVPGSYVAVALDGADDLDSDDPETLAKVKARGTPVEVQPSGATSLTLEMKSLVP